MSSHEPNADSYEEANIPLVLQEDREVLDQSVFQKSRKWASEHKWQLAIAGVATSACLTFASDDSREALHDIKEDLPAVGVGMVAMEALWIGGAGMMAYSVGDKLKNPLKIKSKFPEIAEKANNSKLFTAGFWVNTTGAVGEFVIPAAVVCGKLPPESWGILAPSLVDLSITLAVRKAILNGVRSVGEPKPSNSPINS